MQPPALALAAFSVPLPALFPGSAAVGAYAASVEFRLHLVLAMLAYSLFTIAILHAVLMAVAERRLHRKEGGMGLGALPPLLTLERLLFRLIGAAFVLLTLTLATGIAYSETLFGRAMRFDHKTVFAVLSWLTFGGLLAGRWLHGWRGRTALRWTLTGFVLLILAYVGSRFVPKSSSAAPESLMEQIPLCWAFSALVLMLVLSAYFSIAETAMMAIDRHRLKHLVSEGHSGAIRVTELLEGAPTACSAGSSSATRSPSRWRPPSPALSRCGYSARKTGSPISSAPSSSASWSSCSPRSRPR